LATVVLRAASIGTQGDWLYALCGKDRRTKRRFSERTVHTSLHTKLCLNRSLSLSFPSSPGDRSISRVWNNMRCGVTTARHRDLMKAQRLNPWHHPHVTATCQSNDICCDTFGALFTTELLQLGEAGT